jgi:hypothetical protein
MDDCIKLEKAANGYTVCACDPKIVEANRKRDMKGTYDTPYKDPRREYVFKTLKEAVAFIEKIADKALPGDDYESAFDAAIEDDDEEDY